MVSKRILPHFRRSGEFALKFRCWFKKCTSLPRQNQATQLMKNCNKLLQNCPLWAWGVVKVILSWLLKWRKVALNEIHAPLAINGPYFSSTTALPDSADQSETKIDMRVTNCVSLGSEFSFNPGPAVKMCERYQTTLFDFAGLWFCLPRNVKKWTVIRARELYATTYRRNSLSSSRGKKLINRIERMILGLQTIP